MTPSGTATSARYTIQVDRLRVSEALAPRAILIKLSPTEAEYYADHLWLGTLEEQIREKLHAEFGSHAAGRRTVLMVGTVLAFEQVDTPEGADAHVKLDVAVRFKEADQYAAPALKKQYELRVPAAAPTPREAVKALSHAVEQVAKEITRDVDGLKPPRLK
jgi:uncharacterized lipoprotein YmbA